MEEEIESFNRKNFIDRLVPYDDSWGQPIFTNKKLVKLLLPLVIEQLLAVLVGMVDTLMVAAVGETAVSGVSLVDSLNFLLIQILTALTTGGCVVCSQFIGARDEKRARQSSGQLIMITVIGAAVICAISILGNRVILKAIYGKTEEAVMENAVIYFHYTAMSFPFLALYNSCAALFRSMGNSKISMYTSFIMNGMNIAGNALCIFVLGWGVEGVAIPTLISRAFAAVLIMFLLHKPSNVLRISGLHDLVPDFTLIKRIMAVGIPNGLENGMFQFGKLMTSSLISTLGTASIAAYAAAYSMATFMYLPGNSMGLGMVTIGGQCVGAKKYKQAKYYNKKIVVVNYLLILIICTVIVIFRHPLIGMYHLSAEATQIGVNMTVLHAAMMTVWPVAFLACNVLRASGDAKFTMILAVSSMWIFRVAGAYFFVYVLHTGIYGVWYAMTIDWICRDIFVIWRYRGYEARCAGIYGPGI